MDVSLSPDDAKVIKVASSPLCAEWFFKGEDNTGHVVPVPDWSKDSVPKPAGANITQLFSAQQHAQQRDSCS